MPKHLQKACDYCDDHQEIYLDENTATGGWIATNLDGSKHRHNQQSPKPKPTTSQQVTFRDNEELAKYTYEARQQAIEQSHKENMAESAKLRTSIDSLTAAIKEINTTIKSLSVTKPDLNPKPGAIAYDSPG